MTTPVLPASPNRRTTVTLALALTLASLGCHDTTAPGSALTGVWRQPSVDTYTQFDLLQRGNTITGMFGEGGETAGFHWDNVLGSARLPTFVVTWTVRNGKIYHEALTATLSADGQSFSAQLSTRWSAESALRDVQSSAVGQVPGKLLRRVRAGVEADVDVRSRAR